MVICLEQGADLHMAQLMPLPLTVSCFSRIQIGFTFLVPAHLSSPRQMAVKRVCVCVCVRVCMWQHRNGVGDCHLTHIMNLMLVSTISHFQSVVYDHCRIAGKGRCIIAHTMPTVDSMPP